MVYPGSRSTGCGMCRKRKIRCDEGRPGCRKCELYGAQCPGYKRPLEVRFHAGPRGRITSAAKREEEEACTWPTSSATLPQQESMTPHDRGGALNEVASRLIWARQPRPLCDDESICYFLYEYCIAPRPGVFSGHLDFLEDFLRSFPSTSCLWPATFASAYLSLSRHYKSPQLNIVARRYYGDALRSINTILSREPKSWQDDTLAAIMLLQMFVDTDGGAFGERASHLCGIAAFVESRGQKLFNITPGCSLYAWAFTQLQIHSFITRQPFKCLSPHDAEPDIRYPPIGVHLMVAKMSSFRSSLVELQAAKDPPRPPKDILLTLMRQAMRTQRELETWSCSLPMEWNPNMIFRSDGKLLVTYSTQWLGVILNLYHASLFLFYHSVLRCCQSILDSLPPGITLEKELTETSAVMAEENLTHLTSIICGSIPYSLGEIDNYGQPLATPNYKGSVCYSLIWPLVLVAIYPTSAMDQVRVCKETLARIAAMYGIDLAQSAQDLAAHSIFWI
ncbi:hypothetical protein BJY01DRAFT_242456 [Aspergillus pseudoustus]|uniref:Zn(2)-C6 fungal-type domain-containing protein n=1 Tax=Aspergillus pseudoustus TaxID=1810923 RepID=A0ABR4L0N2_9EURO